MLALEDLDGDGIRDIAVGDSWYDGPLGSEGRVQLHSGAAGAGIGSFDGLAADDAIGYVILPVLDTDGDGCNDLAISIPVYRDLANQAFDGRVRDVRGCPAFASSYGL